MIEVQNLSKSYGRKIAIDNVSFRVEKGEILGFLGPNAAGKTTTMRILTCFFPPTSGTAKVAGFDVFEDSREVRRRIGYLPENPPVYPDMAVDAYLKFAAKIKGVTGKEISRRMDQVVEQVNLGPVRTTKIAKLSKGYKQRVGLAQALIHNPDVLILDEPTVGLDPKQISEVRELIKSLAGDHTIILSTHILPEVSMTCDRVVIIDQGRVVAQDSTENLTTTLQGLERFSLHVDGPVEEITTAVQSISGIKKVTPFERKTDSGKYLSVETSNPAAARAEVAQVIIHKGWKLYEMRLETMSLEDIFLKLTTKEETAGGAE